MKRIVVYTTPTCPYCKLVKEFLKEKNMFFREVSVNTSPGRINSGREAATRMIELSNQFGVPVIDVEGNIIVGWDKAALEEAIK